MAHSPEAVVTQTVNDCLSPLGFRRQGLHWRRREAEVQQQLSIASMRLGRRYRPEWGLQLLAFDAREALGPSELHVRWFFEHATNDDPKLRDAVSGALDLGRSMPEPERAAPIVGLITKYILPCFDAFHTQQSVRAMVGALATPHRAHQFIGVPGEWFPPTDTSGAGPAGEFRFEIRRFPPGKDGR